MRRIFPKDIENYKGFITAKDIVIGNTVVAKANSKIDSSIIASIKDNSRLVSPLFVEDEATFDIVANDLVRGSVLKKAYDAVEKSMNIYRATNTKDFADVHVIVCDIIEEILRVDLNTINIDSSLFINDRIFDHCLNVAIISVLLSVKSDIFSKDIIYDIAMGALLHDIGRLGELEETYPDDPMLRSLTDEVYRNYIQHPVIGYELVQGKGYINTAVSKIILFHHVWENPEYSYDYSHSRFASFPIDYQGKKIYPENRGVPVSIVTVADEFEKLILGRSGNFLSKRDAINFIDSNSEKIYGSAAWLLKKFISPYGVGDVVLTKNGDKAIVKQLTNDTDRPIIKFVNGTRALETVDLRKEKTLEISDCNGVAVS